VSGDAPPAEPKTTARFALLVAGGVALCDLCAVAFAFQPGRSGLELIGTLFVMYAVLAAVAIHRVYRSGRARRYLVPHAGDLAFGAMVGIVLYLGATLAHALLSGRGTPQEAWIVRIYLLLGDPATASPLLGLSVAVVAGLEEITWRALVQRTLEDALSPLSAVVITAVFFTLAHLPTVFLLGDPVAGPNPLVALAAFGCSLVWGYLTIRTQRLAPAFFAHVMFSWAIVEFPVWRP
jgi:membrane protease YdiL (CAAX protease family)